MHSFLTSMKKTAVYSMVVSSLVFSPITASTNEGDKAKTDSYKADAEYSKARAEEIKENRMLSRCTSAMTEYRSAKDRLRTACKDAGLGSGESCLESATRCAAEVKTDSFDTIGTILNTLGYTAGTSLSQGCPQYSGVDWHDRKRQIKDDLEDAKKELADAAKESAENLKDYNEAQTRAQEKMNEAQKEFKEIQNDLSKEKREQVKENQEMQARAMKEIREMQIQKTKLRGQMIKSQQDMALKLIAMTDASGKRACVKGMNDAKKAYESLATSNNASHISKAKEKKAQLIAIYSDCMDAFLKQRQSLNQTHAQELEELTQQMNNLDSDITGVQDSLNLASTQASQIEQEFTKKEQEASENALKASQLAYQQATNAKTELDQKNAATAQKQAAAQAKIQQANNELMTLGPEPYSKDAMTTPGRNAEEIRAAVLAVEDYDDLASKSCPDWGAGKAAREKRSQALDKKMKARK